MQIRYVFQVLYGVISEFYVLFPGSMLNHRPVCVLGSVPGELGKLLKLLLDLIFYVHGEQLRSYKDGQLLSHTVPRQASRRQFTSILSPITAGQLALLEPAERFFFTK